jgi:hypothetical protein
MGRTEKARGIFLSAVLVTATFLAVLEVTAQRATVPSPRSDTAPWVSPARDMDKAIARGDFMSAGDFRRDLYRSAIASGRWEAFLAAGDGVRRLGDATQSPRAAEPDARRLYLTALFRARSQSSLDGVLQTTEALARLGDHDMVLRGLAIARDLAGPDPAAQLRVRAVEDQWAPGPMAAREQGEDGP